MVTSHDRTRRSTSTWVLALALLAGVPACSTQRHLDAVGRATDRRQVTVAWINQGSATEDAWTAAQRAAANQIAAESGGRVKERFIENVELGAATDAMIDELVHEGTDLVFATSLAQEPAITAAARRHPRVRFEQVRGTNTAPNLGTYTGAYEETAYLTGMAAASVAASPRLGFVAQFPQPEMYRIINGYTLGARSVRPDATVSVIWTGSWWNPPIEAAAVDTLAQRGATAIATTCTSLASGEEAKRIGLPWSGHDNDTSAQFGSVWITANLTDWVSYYRRRVSDLIDGRWKADEYYGHMADGFLDLAPFGHLVTAEARERIAKARDQITSGQLDVLAGPLRDNSGTERVGRSEHLTTSQRLKMDWFVDGSTEVDPAIGPVGETR